MVRGECVGFVRDGPSATVRDALPAQPREPDLAHRRAPSVHPDLRMAFKRSWVRLPSAPLLPPHQAARFSWKVRVGLNVVRQPIEQPKHSVVSGGETGHAGSLGYGASD